MTGISDWEMDRVVRVRSLQNIVNTVTTLESLAQQLGLFTTIVVQDNIVEIVQDSLDTLQNATQFIGARHYDLGFKAARKAITAAEVAFFHPTLVGLLYFPG